MPAYDSFYETVKEANMRLQNTVILYEGLPYYVLCVDNHKADGIFRIYLDPVSPDKDLEVEVVPGIPYIWHTEGGVSVGMKMDEYLNNHPDSRIKRKMMNSPGFNKFRPFPLGMVNLDHEVFYAERRPTRHTHQGLTKDMVLTTRVTETGENFKGYPGNRLNLAPSNKKYYDMYVGNYPTLDETLVALSDPDVANLGAAFSRNFAVIRGPARLLFLAYKTETIGIIPNRDRSLVSLSPEYAQLRELIQESSYFSTVNIL